MNQVFWKITAIAGIACLQMTFGWGRLNAWSTITGVILLLLLLTIPWRLRLPWPERSAFAATFSIATILATGRFYEDSLDPDLLSRPRQLFVAWLVLTLAILLAKTLTPSKE